MLDIFKSIMQKIKKQPQGSSTVSDEALELQIATCALLLEMAHADDDYTAQEEARIAALMQERFQLSDAAFQEIKVLSDRQRRESIDLWGFAKTIKEQFPAERKMEVMEMLWSVIYADGTLADYEDHLVHKLAKLLNIDHRDMIAAKVKVLGNNRKQ